jgi:two-component system sensor histidine kinase AlgZ
MNDIPASAQDSPLAILWQPRTLFAIICIGQLIAAIAAMLPGIESNRWTYFGLASLAVQWISLITIGDIYLFRSFLEKRPVLQTAWYCLALLVLNAFLFSVIFWKILDMDLSATRQSAVGFGLNMALVALLLGILGLAAFHNHWSARQSAIRSKQAQLDALHARIQPHFLFNTLNSLLALIHKNPVEAEKLLLNLVDLFRSSLSRNTELTLQEELDITRRYLEIEQQRFGPRMQVVWQLSENLPILMVPALCLQPLAENAVKHGIQPNPNGGLIHVSAESVQNGALVKISNTLPEQNIHDIEGFQIGLATTIERIHLSSQGRNKLETALENGEFVACLHLKAPA